MVLAACGSAPGTSDANTHKGDINLGLLLPYTGEYSWVGENVEEAARLLIDKGVNKSGGIGGHQINLVRGDTEGAVDTGVLAARKLVNTNQVVAFIGPTSLSFTGVRQVITDTKTPAITPTAGTVEFDKAGKTLFHRTVPSDALGGRAIAKALADPASFLAGKSYKKVALMVGDAPALISFEEPIKTSMQEYGLPLIENTQFSVGRESYRSEVATTLKKKPDMIILVGAPADSAKIMRQAKQSGYQGSWFVTQDQTNADYVKLAGADVVQGVYGLEEAAPEAAKSLRAKYTTALGHDPKIFQTNTYDAVNVATLAMYAADKQDGKVTKTTIEAHIAEVANHSDGDVVVTSFEEGKVALDAGKTIDYQGLSGPVDFDEFGSITSPFQILRVDKGAFGPVSIIDAEQLK